MIQRIAREGFKGNRYAIIVHKQPHLNDGLMTFFLADTELALPLLQNIPFFIQAILVRAVNFEIEVCDIVIDHFRCPTGFFYQVRVDAPKDLVFVISEEGKSIVDIVTVKVLQNWLVIVIVLPDGGTLGRGVQEPAKNQEFCKAVDIVFHLSETFIRGEEVSQPQFLKDPFEEEVAKELRMAEAVGAPFTEGKVVYFRRLRCGAIREQGRNQGISCLEGILQALDIIWLAVVISVKGTDVMDDLLLGDLFPIRFCDPNRLNETEIRFSIICKAFDVHSTLQKTYRPTHIVYHKSVKKARKTLQNKKKIYFRGLTKWQTREDIKNKKNMDPLSMYFMKVGNVIVKCSYAGNGRSLAGCFLSYLEKKVMLLD